MRVITVIVLMIMAGCGAGNNTVQPDIQTGQPTIINCEANKPCPA